MVSQFCTGPLIRFQPQIIFIILVPLLNFLEIIVFFIKFFSHLIVSIIKLFHRIFLIHFFGMEYVRLT